MKRPLLIPFLATAVLIVVMRIQGASLVIRPGSPLGIIDLEFAWTEPRFLELMALWSRSDVLGNLYLDFLFIAAYVWFLSTAAKAASTRLSSNRLSKVMVWMAVAAGALDVLENACLLYRVHGGSGTGALVLAGLSAALKFAAVAVVLLFLFYVLLSRRGRGVRTAPLV